LERNHRQLFFSSSLGFLIQGCHGDVDLDRQLRRRSIERRKRRRHRRSVTN
jgi:hypothetical protein